MTYQHQRRNPTGGYRRRKDGTGTARFLGRSGHPLTRRASAQVV